MKTTIIEQAKKVIDLRRNQAENDAINNKIEALKDEKFKTLYQTYVTKIIDSAKENKKLTAEDKQLKTQYLARLKELGLPSIEPNYFCKNCNDTGYIDGKYCYCLKKEVNKILRRDSGFDFFESFDDVNFDIFENKDYMKKLYQKMQEWCHSNFDKNLIFIAGETGVGKTHLIKCMANELINLNHIVRFTTSFSMHQDFVKSYSTRDLDEKNYLIDKYLSVEVLFIDDLGTEIGKNRDITLNYLYQVLNERKINKLPTVITSNLDFYDIRDYYDERISSRIIDKSSSICVYIKDKDLRLNKD